MAVIVAGSFVLTPATAIRYERHDRKVRQMSQEEAMGEGLGKEGIKHNPRRRMIGNERDEYYVGVFNQLDSSALTDMPLDAHGQRSGQLGTKADQAIRGGTGWETIVGLPVEWMTPDCWTTYKWRRKTPLNIRLIS